MSFNRATACPVHPVSRGSITALRWAGTDPVHMTVSIRPAEPGDVEDVAAFTRDTWSDQDRGDYLPEAFPRS